MSKNPTYSLCELYTHFFLRNQASAHGQTPFEKMPKQKVQELTRQFSLRLKLGDNISQPPKDENFKQRLVLS
jgi:hypothetical protein